MRPLSRTIRNKLFYISVLIFIIGAPLLILYSLGYRFEEGFSFRETGGIFIRSNESTTTVFLEGEMVKKTGTLFRNTFIQNLSAYESYEVWVEKEGYHSWHKILPVGPHIVTESATLLLPKRIECTPLLKEKNGVEKADALGYKEKEEEHTLSLNEEEESVLFLPSLSLQKMLEEFEKNTPPLPLKENVSEEKIKEEDMAEKEDLFYASLLFSSEAKKYSLENKIFEDASFIKEKNNFLTYIKEGNLFYVWMKKDTTPLWFMCLPPQKKNEEGVCRKKGVIDWDNDILYYDFYPQRNDVFIVGIKNALYAVEMDDRSERNIQPLFEGEEEISFRLFDEGIVVKDKKDSLCLLNISF
jgi:hypothetical protein